MTHIGFSAGSLSFCLCLTLHFDVKGFLMHVSHCSLEQTISVWNVIEIIPSSSVLKKTARNTYELCPRSVSNESATMNRNENPERPFILSERAKMMENICVILKDNECQNLLKKLKESDKIFQKKGKVLKIAGSEKNIKAGYQGPIFQKKKKVYLVFPSRNERKILWSNTYLLRVFEYIEKKKKNRQLLKLKTGAFLLKQKIFFSYNIYGLFIVFA